MDCKSTYSGSTPLPTSNLNMMITVWGLLLGIPLLAFGGVACLSPKLFQRFTRWFRLSVSVAACLTAVAWFWTAWECDNLGIEAIDRFIKAFPGEIWILATVLVPLTIAWMPKNLPVRALSGILMLLPALLFRTTRLYRPPAGTWFSPVDIFVYTAYIGIVIGMYGMFYPWRLEKGMDLVLARDCRARAFGAFCALLGLVLITIGCAI